MLKPSPWEVGRHYCLASPSLVALKLEDEIDISAGMIGKATIFTEEFGKSHAIRKIMLRMDTWMNYVKP